jgi:predicted TIM-barrel fold metal-dependent hydrolase
MPGTSWSRAGLKNERILTMTQTSPFCAAADASPKTPRLALPPGSCDCHAHVFGPASQYPYIDNRTYTPPDATLENYLQLHRRIGIERGVLVQPSVYGTDNRLHMEALSAIRRAGLDYRGVCVVAPDVAETELDRLDRAGFCGVRMNLLFQGGIDWADVTALAVRIANRGWHLQFLINVAESVDILEQIPQLPVPVVIDHMGHMNCDLGLHNEGFQTLLTLLRKNLVWVKLSGSYRISQEGAPPYTDVVPFARALVKANPERCIWGSDWPHPHFPGGMPNDGDLVDLISEWVPDSEQSNAVLVRNPARLYGFKLP